MWLEVESGVRPPAGSVKFGGCDVDANFCDLLPGEGCSFIIGY